MCQQNSKTNPTIHFLFTFSFLLTCPIRLPVGPLPIFILFQAIDFHIWSICNDWNGSSDVLNRFSETTRRIERLPFWLRFFYSWRLRYLLLDCDSGSVLDCAVMKLSRVRNALKAKEWLKRTKRPGSRWASASLLWPTLVISFSYTEKRKHSLLCLSCSASYDDPDQDKLMYRMYVWRFLAKLFLEPAANDLLCFYSDLVAD